MTPEPLSLLLVDDERSFAEILALRLSDEHGFHVTIANSGNEALEHLEKSRRGFDVILLDYRMPDLTGLNVLQWMHEQKNKTPVVMLTAAGSEEIAVEAMKLGAYDYLRKEHIELPHLANVLRAADQCHLFEIEKELEEEQTKTIRLNVEATDKMRDVVNAITPTLNDSLAQIAAEIETNASRIIASLPEDKRAGMEASLKDIQRNVNRLETGIRGLLSLYRIVYAHHAVMPEIEILKKEIEAAARKDRAETGLLQESLLKKNPDP
ncbi:MAG: response regulator [Bacteroidota bacterium]